MTDESLRALRLLMEKLDGDVLLNALKPVDQWPEDLKEQLRDSFRLQEWLNG